MADSVPSLLNPEVNNNNNNNQQENIQQQQHDVKLTTINNGDHRIEEEKEKTVDDDDDDDLSSNSIVNVNVGILGHVDSGKVSFLMIYQRRDYIMIIDVCLSFVIIHFHPTISFCFFVKHKNMFIYLYIIR